MEIASKWRVNEVNTDIKQNLIQKGYSDFTATLLANRGVDNAQKATEFLNPKCDYIHSPFKMLDLDRAAKRIKKIINNGGKILIYGHDDVDGIASVMVMSETINALGGEYEVFFPHRLYEEYKISTDVIDHCKETGIDLILTVDIGISSYDEVVYAHEIGVKVIITDHHMVPPEIPPALAVVNPKRACCPYPFDMLAGVGVAYKLAQILLSDESYQELLKELLAFVALGSISDKVPFIDENRVFVHEGLSVISTSNRACWQIIRNKGSITGHVSEDFIRSQAVPFLTAGRSRGGKHLGYDFLNTNSKEEAKKLLTLLEQKTRQQRIKSEKVIENMMRKVVQLELEKEKLILLVDEGVPISMLGLCASQLFKRYKRPAIVIGYKSKHAVGEARAPEGFSLIDAFEHCSEYLIQFGGHKPAAGFSIAYRNVGNFTKKILKYADLNLDWELLVPTINAEFVVTQDMINRSLVDQVLKFAPFGQKNKNPVFLIKKAKLIKITNKPTYTLNNFPINWGWKMPDEIKPEDTFDIMFTFDQFEDQISLRIEDIQTHEFG